jgi:hypothetical protein
VVLEKIVVVLRGGFGGWGGVGKWLVESDVPRDDYFSCSEIETVITTMLRRVSKEDTFRGSR